MQDLMGLEGDVSISRLFDLFGIGSDPSDPSNFTWAQFRKKKKFLLFSYFFFIFFFFSGPCGYNGGAQDSSSLIVSWSNVFDTLKIKGKKTIISYYFNWKCSKFKRKKNSKKNVDLENAYESKESNITNMNNKVKMEYNRCGCRQEAETEITEE